MWNVTCADVTQGILIFFPLNRPGFQGRSKASKTWGAPTIHQGERELTVASFSIYSSGAPREARPISCNEKERVTGTAGVCPSSTFTLSSSLVLDHKEGDRWLDAFRKAQVDSDRFVKSSLATLQRITELWTGRSLLHHLVPHVHFANEKTREKRWPVQGHTVGCV